jgi:hypothetical protein
VTASVVTLEREVFTTKIGLWTTELTPRITEHCIARLILSTMRMIKYLDFALQTLAFLTPFCTDFLGLETPVFIALLIGPLQVTSSGFSLLRDAPLLKYKTIHLASSLGFFIVYVLGLNLGLITEKSVYHLIAPLILAAYYYLLTIIWVLRKEPKDYVKRVTR